MELARKLVSHSVEDVKQVLDDLAEQGLQSDERFAEQYVRMRRNKGYGPLRIRAELKEKGIASLLIDTWLDAGEEDWPARMIAVAEKKYGQDLPREQSELARRARFLSHRGFPSHLIREYLFGNA